MTVPLAAFASASPYKLEGLSRLIINSHTSVTWLDTSDRYALYRSEHRDTTGLVRADYYMVDTRRRRTSHLVADTTLARLLQPFSKKPLLFTPEGQTTQAAHRFYVTDLRADSNDARKLCFAFHGRNLCIDTRTMRLDTLPSRQKQHADRPSPQYDRHYSADSLYYVYAIGHDLYMARNERCDTGFVVRDTLRLTTDGQRFWSYALGGNSVRNATPTEWQEHHGRRSRRWRRRETPLGRWIGDTHTYLVIREDIRRVPLLPLVDNLAQPRPVVRMMKYSMPGDSIVARYSTQLVNADTAFADGGGAAKAMTTLDLDAYPDQSIDVPRLRPLTISGPYAYVIRKSRPQDAIDLIRIDGRDGTARVLIHEDCKPHLNEQLFAFHVLNEGRDILWWAERGDRGQWYHYDGECRRCRPLTPPTLVAAEIEDIDTIGRHIIFKAYGTQEAEPTAAPCNPCYAHYYRVGLDGRGLTHLTPGNANHAITLSPSHRFVTDHAERNDMAGADCIRDLSGRLVADLGRADLSPLTARGWQPPRQLQLMAADGQTPIYGLVYTPHDMKPSDRLPIISNPYPGPHTDLVELGFAIDDNGNQTLAEDGFIVINFSYRGSNPWRGRRFYTHGYGNLRDYVLDDDYAAIRQVAQLIPQADTTRVGIYGHSGGGFVATAALLTRPDFYSTAVAASGNHDNNIYLRWWGETFHGLRQTTDSLGHTHWDAHIPTTLELAPRLRGNLLLIHGDVDDNVHPACTLRMADALIRAGKRFDMLMLPGKDHGLGDQYYNNVIRAYFCRHLLGKSVPIDIGNL